MGSLAVAAYLESPRIPIIDLSLLKGALHWRQHLGRQIDWACAEFGFFYVVNHAVDAGLSDRLFDLGREFFAWSLERKLKIHMSRGGRAWRGYFPVGEELTAGVADLKEGLYFGSELAPEDERAAAGLPLHGGNLFPDIEGFRDAVIRYMSAVSALAQTLLDAIALALGQNESYFAKRYTHDPTVLLRMFNYPPAAGEGWGVGEHTDYGLLTLLKQDAVGGLQFRYDSAWLDVPEVPGSFVVNVGDVLESLTGGRYRSAAHRVRNGSTTPRISVPLFFDPGFGAQLGRIAGMATTPRFAGRALSGTCGEYLLAKVSRVFPELGERVLR